MDRKEFERWRDDRIRVAVAGAKIGCLIAGLTIAFTVGGLLIVYFAGGFAHQR